jgi:hypothetical protein
MHTRNLSFDGLRKTRDHYIPLSRGGTNTRENIRQACYKCNNLKGNMMPEVWERFMLDNPLWWTVQINVKCQTVETTTKKASAAALRGMTAEENARRMMAYRALRKDEPFPIEFDDPIKQAAWESIYKDRKWLLRVPAAVAP